MTAGNGSSVLPDPPVPHDLDLRSFHWLKLNFVALLSSTFNQTSNDLGWRCGVTLWLRGMHQIPASSLPADDEALCQLAGLGRDIKRWKKAKDVALHGFTLHSDGRLYHKICAQNALDAAIEREKQQQRNRDRHKNRHGGNLVDDTTQTTNQPPYMNGGNHRDDVPFPFPVSVSVKKEATKKKLLTHTGAKDF